MTHYLNFNITSLIFFFYFFNYLNTSTAKRRDEGGKDTRVRSDSPEVKETPIEHLACSHTNGVVDCVARTHAHTDFRLEDEMRKRAEGESAVFANFHVGGGCVSLAYRYRDNRNNRIIISVY